METQQSIFDELKYVNLSDITQGQNDRKNITEESVEDLKASIEASGVLDPLLLRKEGKELVIVDGHRRFFACQILNISMVPAVISTLEDETLVAVIKNTQRKNFSVFEEALALQRILIENKVESQTELARLTGCKKSRISQKLSILKLPKEILDKVMFTTVNNGIPTSERYYRELGKLHEFSELQIKIFEKLVKEGWSLKQLEKLVKKIIEPKQEVKDKEPKEELPAPDENSIAFGSDPTYLQIDNFRVEHINGSLVLSLPWEENGQWSEDVKELIHKVVDKSKDQHEIKINHQTLTSEDEIDMKIDIFLEPSTALVK